MISSGKKKGTVRFAFSPEDDAKDVSLAGDFTDWTPKKMAKQRENLFVSVVRLSPGEHEYKFVVDGRWLADPDNPRCGPNAFGTVNSVVRVE